jgi:hypothetical protein
MRGKGHDGVGDIPERDLWQTEQSFWDVLDRQYDFEFDCCANANDTKTMNFSEDFEKVLETTQQAWMNPPFSKAREMFVHFFKAIRHGVAIYRIDNPETKIWQEIIFPNCDWVFIPKGRVSYTPFDVDMRGGKGTRFPSALIGIGTLLPKHIEGVAIKTIKKI